MSKTNKFVFTFDIDTVLLKLIYKHREEIFQRGSSCKAWQYILKEFNELLATSIVQSRTLNNRFQNLRKDIDLRLSNGLVGNEQALNENEKLLIFLSDYLGTKTKNNGKKDKKLSNKDKPNPVEMGSKHSSIDSSSNESTTGSVPSIQSNKSTKVSRRITNDTEVTDNDSNSNDTNSNENPNENPSNKTPTLISYKSQMPPIHPQESQQMPPIHPQEAQQMPPIQPQESQQMPPLLHTHPQVSNQPLYQFVSPQHQGLPIQLNQEVAGHRGSVSIEQGSPLTINSMTPLNHLNNQIQSNFLMNDDRINPNYELYNSPKHNEDYYQYAAATNKRRKPAGMNPKVKRAKVDEYHIENQLFEGSDHLNASLHHLQQAHLQQAEEFNDFRKEFYEFKYEIGSTLKQIQQLIQSLSER